MTTNTAAPHTNRTTAKRRGLVSLALAALVTTGTVQAVAAPAPDSIAVLDRQAQPLTDLHAVGRMIGAARVVGMGEASHSVHEFFALKQRLFEYLVTHKGFTTFALETSWSTGLRLNAYVLHGIGDPETIMEQEFQGQYVFWNTEEYLDLVRWMRHYNLGHPDRPQLRFAGNDLGYPGPEAFTQVGDYAAAYRPGLARQFEDLYTALRPEQDTEVGPWMQQQLTRDAAQRRERAERARKALALLRDEGRPAGTDAGRAAAYDWAVQNATVIAQTFTAYAFPDDRFADRMRYRDRAMAANTAWLLDQHQGKILLASSNGHIAYTSDNPAEFPEPAGAALRERLGSRYVNIGLTFNRGTVNALPDATARTPRTYTVAPAPEGHNDHLLDRVALRDFAVDLRAARAGGAGSWLTRPRPTRSYGLYWSPQDPQTSLSRSYDILVHLHEVEAAHLR
ncbi:erythromycin esterase family protein [Streptomyces sp. 4N124]|uniref:erythromycin esterase family protein n=1 Tax=Streptomyces sp. 4N124 TaxID=3457420 RepID=UPI003FD5C0A5